MNYEREALLKIRKAAHLLAFATADGEISRRVWDIFWLAVAGLEGREKAVALDVFSELSGISTDVEARSIGVEEVSNG